MPCRRCCNNEVPSVDHSRHPPQKVQEDVEQQLGAAAALQERDERREEDGQDEEEYVCLQVGV